MAALKGSILLYLTSALLFHFVVILFTPNGNFIYMPR